MRHFAARVSVSLVCLLTATIVSAQQSPRSDAVPRVMHITGAVAPTNGKAAGSVETITLAIYAEETGGTPLWEETQQVAVDSNGRYSILLGATRPDGLPLDLFASGDARWLGRRLERDGEREQARVLLASVPYALKAADTDTLGGRPASDYLLSRSAARSAATGSTEESLPGPLDILPGAVNGVPKYYSATDLGVSSIFDIGGLVGVGTQSPVDAMHLKFTNTAGTMTGVAVQNMGSTASSYSGMLFYDHTGALGQFQGFNNSTHEYRINNIAPSGTINFMTGSVSRFKVANNGFIGINNANPENELHIGEGGDPTIKLDGAVNVPGSGPRLRMTESFPSDYGFEMFMDSNDNALIFRSLEADLVFADNILTLGRSTGLVGINTRFPTDRLQVVGDIRVGSGTTGCVKDADGTVIAGVCSSDRRFKKDITSFASSLEKVARLQPVTFHWRADEFPSKHFGNSESFGLIAQDVEKILPELVTTDENGYKAVRYNALPFHMLQAIKDLKSENDDLKARLAAVESALASLAKR